MASPSSARFCLLALGVSLASCHHQAAEAPPLAATKAVEAPPPATFAESLAAAVVSGDGVDAAAATLKSDAKGLCAEAEAVLVGRLTGDLAVGLAPGSELSPAEAERALKLLLLCPAKGAPTVFDALTTAPALRTAGWRLAVQRPSPRMAERIGRRLSSTLEKRDLDGLALPVVADAVRVNHVPGAYTFLRQGLALSGSGAFLVAMIALDPEHASDDAIAYLARATPDELQAGAPTSLDPDVCRSVLDYFAVHSPSLTHPNFGHLFLFAVAKDEGISRRAAAVIAKLAATQPGSLAAVLTKMTRDVQVAFAGTLRGADSRALYALRSEIKLHTTDAVVLAALEP